MFQPISDSTKLTDKDIETMSPMALNDPCTPGNPKKTTLDDMRLMYKHSIEGKLFNQAMQILKLLIVEGNTEKENLNFNNAGCVSQSENFKLHIKKIQPNSEVDITKPEDDKSISKIFNFTRLFY